MEAGGGGGGGGGKEEDLSDVVVVEESSEAASAPGEVVSAFGYVTGPASIERGVDVDGVVVEQYDLDTHVAEYVPKHKRAAGSLGTRGVVLVDTTDDDGDDAVAPAEEC